MYARFTMAGWFLKLLGVLLSLGFNVSESQILSFAPDKGTTVTISRSRLAGAGCKACFGDGPKRQCLPNITLTGGSRTSVEFSCSPPHKSFTLDISQEIVCKGMSCNGNVVQKEVLLFRDFNRTFTWDLRPERPRSFQLAFSGTGMRQVLPSETCPGQHTYSLTVTQSSGTATIGTFCPNGTVTAVLAQSQSRLALSVPGGRDLASAVFHVSVGPEIKTLAVVQVTLPQGSSATEFFSPNYPRGFPDDDLMAWDFPVPDGHNFSVRFLNYSEPRCVKKDVVVEYHKTGKMFVGKGLAVPQPANRQGNFSLYLRNCEMDRRAPAILTLHFQVSVVKSGVPVVCSVDLRKEDGVSLHIEKKDSRSKCQMKKDSVVQEIITMASGNISSLSFHSCLREELMLTVSKTIGCRQWKACPVGKVPLSVPASLACLPAALRRVTWHLRAPAHGTVELLQSRGSLRHSLPGQRCNASISIAVAEDNGVAVGNFCPNGSIHRIQIHANVSVTATPSSASEDLGHASAPFLDASFSREITERYIFTVVPQKGVPVLLATPGWPAGMKEYSTVSWIVTVPPKYGADLVFLNVSQPKCHNRHTGIKVQMLGSREEMFSRREDEKTEGQLSIPESFYLNMSNCLPEQRDFSVLSQITLHRKTSSLLAIILGTVGALLFLMVIVLIIVCVVTRKKRRQMAPNVSIYNPNGADFGPGPHRFPKSRADNDSHVYASIEDTMVYGHLLKNDGCISPISNPQVDVYQTFTGPVEAPPPPLPHIRAPEGGDPDVDVYRPFVYPSESTAPGQQQPVSPEDTMVDNELYDSRGGGLTPPSPHREEQAEPQA
ncbi:hypothetical protein AAFF_G00183940 [Aldrovandia affinis]|uniref:CUB domain-containing protein 1-like n=1 Tax=Aldrovandia affinis TaxID=143900 RepID=A0AAD7RJZ7_9TELE|nr:hypothetical protein AAFF_G00183940 [Aldrovandia affinis]